MTVTKALCPSSPDGKHTWVHGRCIDCDALKTFVMVTGEEVLHTPMNIATDWKLRGL